MTQSENWQEFILTNAGSVEKLKALFAEMDADQSGGVDLGEWLSWCEKQRNTRGVTEGERWGRPLDPDGARPGLVLGPVSSVPRAA